MRYITLKYQKNIKIVFCVIIASLLIEIILTPLRIINIGLSSLAGFFVYLVLTFSILTLFKEKKISNFILMATLVGIMIIQLPVRIINYQETKISIPDFLSHLLGILFGYLIFSATNKIKLLFFIIGCSMAIFIFQKGNKLWANKIFYGSFFENVRIESPVPIEGYSQNHIKFKREDLKGKILMIDFWHTKCSICFDEFPELQSFYNKVKYQSSFQLFALNKPLKSDSVNQAFNMLKERNYSFPILIPTLDSLPEIFNISYYPTVIVIDENHIIVFKGDLKEGEEIVYKLLNSKKKW